ncbi:MULTISPECIES: hypothetical protein [unclassified Prochlorococcus]|uniref:hypothetical protein n=1 Tax=unclassified Prochlorococcus TaxID=2627481 RepID=UPI00187C889C|nr:MULTISPECIES: hypothetical protein [unclassified Prochlorococcus]
MKKRIRHFKKPNNLFNPNGQGISTYDLTYVTSNNNKIRNEELRVALTKEPTKVGNT